MQVRETAANENCSGTSLADILQSALPAETSSSTSTSGTLTTSQSSKTTNVSYIFSVMPLALIPKYVYDIQSYSK